MGTPQRECLMGQAGRCRLSFVTLGKEGQFMCAKHWALVPEELKQKLQAEWAATSAQYQAWQQVQADAITAVSKATGSID
jgi:ABC-type enterobactin transport system permease subunit